jgi:hypothetical protein
MINTSVLWSWLSLVTTAPPARMREPGDGAAFLRVRPELTDDTE